ncbi:MAG: hypothetical protein PHX78_07970 [bacterium]|nr:hypothetical protein [bacterium]
MYLSVIGKIILFLKVFSTVILYFYIPGFFLDKKFLKDKLSIFESLGLRITLGLASFTPLAIAGYFLNLTIGNINIMWIVIVLMCLIYTITSNDCSIELKRPSFDLNDWYPWLLLITLFFVFINMQSLAENTSEFTGDYWYHIAQTTFFIDTKIQNIYPFFKEPITNSIYPFNAYYIVYGLIIRVTGQNTLFVWEILRLVIIIIMTSNFFLLFKKLTQDYQLSLIAICFFWLCYLYIPNNLWMIWEVNFPRFASMYIFLPAIIYNILLYLENFDKKILTIGILLSTAIQSWHIANIEFISLLLFGLLTGFLLFLQFQNAKKIVIYMIIVLVGPVLLVLMSFPLVNKISNWYSMNNPAYVAEYGNMFYKIGDSLYILKLSRIAGNPWNILGLLILPASIIFFKKKNIIISSYLSGLYILPLLIVFNPLILLILWKIGFPPFTTERYVWIQPVAEGVGLFMGWIILNKLLINRKYLGQIIIILLIFMLFSNKIAPVKNRKLLANVYSDVKFETSKEFLDFCSYFSLNVPVSSMVFTDSVTSCMLPALRGIHVVTTYKRWAQIVTKDIPAINDDMQMFFNKAATSKERAKIVSRYNTDFIVINRMWNQKLDKISTVEESSVEGFELVYDSPLYIVLKKI